MQERRAHTIDADAIRQIVKEAVAEELADARSLKKNGHTVKQWLGKLATPERVLMGAILLVQVIFQLGGRVQAIRASVQQAVTAASAAAVAAAQADRQATRATMRSENVDKRMTIEDEKIEALRRDNATLRDRLSLTMTRSEFQAALKQQLLPQLERIESQLK